MEERWEHKNTFMLTLIVMLLMFPSEGNHSHQIMHSARWRGRLKTMWKKKVIFHWFVFFCRSLYTFLYGAMTPSISMFQLYIQESSLQESVYENIVKTCWLLALTLTLTMFWFFFMIQTVNLFAAVRHRYRCDFLCITMLALLGRSEGTTQCTCVVTMIFLWISEYTIYTTHEQILACCTKHVYCCLTERLKN